jgi:hypothetical protein
MAGETHDSHHAFLLARLLGGRDRPTTARDEELLACVLGEPYRGTPRLDSQSGPARHDALDWLRRAATEKKGRFEILLRLAELPWIPRQAREALLTSAIQPPGVLLSDPDDYSLRGGGTRLLAQIHDTRSKAYATVCHMRSDSDAEDEYHDTLVEAVARVRALRDGAARRLQTAWRAARNKPE